MPDYNDPLPRQKMPLNQPSTYVGLGAGLLVVVGFYAAIGAIIGAIVGVIVGGPVGAAAGAALGASIGAGVGGLVFAARMYKLRNDFILSEAKSPKQEQEAEIPPPSMGPAPNPTVELTTEPKESRWKKLTSIVKREEKPSKDKEAPSHKRLS